MAYNSPHGGSPLRHDDWFYLDQLPVELRKALAASVTNWSASWVLTAFKKSEKIHGTRYSIKAMLKVLQEANNKAALEPWKISARKSHPSPTRTHRVKPLVQSW